MDKSLEDVTQHFNVHLVDHEADGSQYYHMASEISQRTNYNIYIVNNNTTPPTSTPMPLGTGQPTNMQLPLHRLNLLTQVLLFEQSTY